MAHLTPMGRFSTAGSSRHLVRPALRVKQPLRGSLVAQTSYATEASASKATRIKEFGYAKNFEELFTLGELIGTGSFGKVYVAILKETGEKYAVKSIPKRYMAGHLEAHLVRRVQHEVDIYANLGHSLNVASMHSVFENDLAVDIVTELCTGGELWHRLVKHGKYNEPVAAHIISEVLRTIAQCHAKGVVLRDVKPDNFLFQTEAEDSPLKMIDFGLADYCETEQLLTDRAGTTWYLAPEVLKQCYGQKCDMWSAGVLAYELLCAQLPFRGEDGEVLAPTLLAIRSSQIMGKDVFRGILTLNLERYEPPLNVLTDGAYDFLKKLLMKDPADRLSVDEALRHPWLVRARRQWNFSHHHYVARTAEQEEERKKGSPVAYTSVDDEDSILGGSMVQRLQRYGTYGKLKKLALCKVATLVNQKDESVCAIREAFEELDPTSTGHVPYTTVVEVLNSGTFDLSRVEISQVVAELSVDNKGRINYYDWLAALLDWREIQECDAWDSWVEKVFEEFDTEHLGRLTVSELETLLCDGDKCPLPDTVQAAMRLANTRSEASQKGGGNAPDIDLAAFSKMMKTNKSDRLELFETRRISFDKNN